MKQKRKDIIKSFISVILVIIVLGIGIKDFIREVNADTETITLYFIDNTSNYAQWNLWSAGGRDSNNVLRFCR